MENIKSKRNGKIELLRFLMCLVITLMHTKEFISKSSQHIAIRGYLAVEFFFLVSGYLMMQHIFKKEESNKDLGKDTWSFIANKIKSMIPNYYVSFFIATVIVVVNWIINKKKYVDILKHLLETVWELLFLNMAGFGDFRGNGVDWYISAMLISMLVLYPIARKNKNLFVHVIAPIIALSGLSYLYLETGFLGGVRDELFGGVLLKGMLRGFSEICLGATLYGFSMKIQEYNFKNSTKKFFSLLELLLYLLIFVLLIFIRSSEYEFLTLLLISFAVTMSFSRISYFENRFDNDINMFLGKISFDIYLNHFSAVRIVKFFINNLGLTIPMTILVYYVFVIVLTILEYNISKFIKKSISKKQVVNS